MTSIGQRPTLAEIIAILTAVTAIEANADALNSESKTFRVVLTFDRSLMQGVRGWGDGQPTPSHLMDEIYSHLAQWQQQKTREAQWVSKDGEVSSVDALLAHYYGELGRVSDVRPETVATRMQKRVLSSTMLRLQELKERRAAGGIYNATENRREKARKTWAEDEFEAPNQEKAQQEAHARTQASEEQERYGDGIFNDALSDHLRRKYRAYFEGIFGSADWGRAHQQQPKPSSGAKRWWEVLEVNPNSSKTDIEKAYRRMAAKFHPDRYKGADRDSKMTEINVARDEALGGL